MTTTTAPPRLAVLVDALARRLVDLDAGAKAELRRLSADSADRWRSPIFYRLHVELIEAQSTRGTEKQWAMILSGMARLPHQRGARLGRQLAEHGFAERRLVRLLDADADHLPAELRALVAFLDSKGARLDWLTPSNLVLSVDADDRDAVRRTIAADYFRTLTRTAKA